MSAPGAYHHHFEISKHLECQQPFLVSNSVLAKVLYKGKGGNNNVYLKMPHFNTTTSLDDLIKEFVSPSLPLLALSFLLHHYHHS